jgi:hypothetical protein
VRTRGWWSWPRGSTESDAVDPEATSEPSLLIAGKAPAPGKMSAPLTVIVPSLLKIAPFCISTPYEVNVFAVEVVQVAVSPRGFTRVTPSSTNCVADGILTVIPPVALTVPEPESVPSRSESVSPTDKLPFAVNVPPLIVSAPVVDADAIASAPPVIDSDPDELRLLIESESSSE